MTKKKPESPVQILHQVSFLLSDVVPHLGYPAGTVLEVSEKSFRYGEIAEFLRGCGVDTGKKFEVHSGIMDKNRINVVQRLGHVGSLTFKEGKEE